ncbi:MAG: AsmA-like C-terminal domain-containing protein [Thermodesulfobacteriota bacterium]|nr:AsmA-like C-terminal domain-containing protein [Thermodesulfobacteriota bacterium]
MPLTLKYLNRTSASLVLLLFLCLIWLFVSSFLIVNTPYVKKRILDHFFPHQNISLGRIQVSIFPHPYLEIKTLGITLEKNITVKMHQARIYPDRLDLMKGRINIHKISIKAFNMMSDSFFLPDFPSRLFDHIPVSQKDLSVDIQNFSNSFLKNLRMTLSVSPRDRQISGFLNTEKLTLNCSEQKDLPLPESIDSLWIKDFSGEFVYSDYGADNGADDDGADSGMLRFSAKGRSLSVTATNTEKIITSRFSASLTAEKDRIRAELAPVDLKEPEMTGSVCFSKTSENTQLTFNGSRIRIGQVKKKGAALFPDNSICRSIFDIIPKGRVSDLVVSFSGKNLKDLFNAHKMMISAKVSQGRVNIPQTGLVADNLKGNVKIKNGILSTETTRGNIQNSIIHKGTLDVDLLGSDYDFNGRFNLHADLRALPSVLKDLLPGTMLATELERCQNIQGHADGVLVLKNINNRVSVSVQAEGISLSGKYQRLPGIFSIQDGNFSFADHMVSVDTLKGSLNQSFFNNVSASISLSEHPVLNIRSGAAEIQINEIYPWLASFKKNYQVFSKIKSIKGEIYLDHISVKGPLFNPDKIQYSLEGRLRHLLIERKKSIPDICVFACVFDVSDKNALLSRLDADILDSRFLASLIKIPFIANLSAPFSIFRADCRLKNSIAFTGDLLFDQGPEVYIAFSGETQDTPVKRIRIKKRGTENGLAAVKTDKSTAPDHKDWKVTGEIDTDTIKKIFKTNTILYKKINEITQGQNYLIQAEPASEPVLSTNFIDLDQILETWKTSSEDQAAESMKWIQKLMPEFTLYADILKYKQLKFSPFNSKIRLLNSCYTIDIKKTSFCTIDLCGQIKKKRTSFFIDMDLDAENKDLDRAISCFFHKNDIINGPFTMTGNLNTYGKIDAISDNIEGELHFSSNKGRIHRLTLLSRVLSVINLSKIFKGVLPDITQNGFGYTSLEINAALSKDEVLIKNSVINGNDMTFIITGPFDMKKKEMDITCLVAPFKSGDMIVEKIPVLGSILKGRLISIPVRISGKFDDPNVALISPSDIGKGLINTMFRVLKAPFKIIEKLPL